MRPILRPIISGIGTLNMAVRAAGQPVAIAAARSGRATKIPTTGKGFEMAIIPAAPAAAESPIQRPMASASASFAKRDISMKTITALTANTISVAVTTVPMKSNMLSSCSVYLHFSFRGEADWPESSCHHPNCVRESALSAPTPDGPMAAATAACARRHASKDADTAARPLLVTETRRVGELLKLGFEIAESTVSKYMIRHRGPPSQTWRTFLRNHADAIAAIDLCVVPTVTFECLFAFLVVGHGRRQLLWFAVTRHPTAEWLAQQIMEAFPWDTAPTYLVRDNDGTYGQAFTSRVRAMGIRDRPISPRSPWQNPYIERLIGTLRRDCLDHVLIYGE